MCNSGVGVLEIYKSIMVISCCQDVKKIIVNNYNRSCNVYSVFSKAIYIKIDNKFICITYEHGNFPSGIIVKDKDFSELKELNQNDYIIFDKDKIYIPKKKIYLDFSKSIIWAPMIYPMAHINSQKLFSNLEVLRIFLLNNSKKIIFINVNKFIDSQYKSEIEQEELYCQYALGIIQIIYKKWSLSLYDEAISTSRKIIGLGPGLTPSGDDFLLGMMSSIYLGFNRNLIIFNNLRKVFREILNINKNTTTEISHHFLKEASFGRFPEKLSALSNAIFYGNNSDIVRHAKELSIIGATSGYDMILGVYFGVTLTTCFLN